MMKKTNKINKFLIVASCIAIFVFISMLSVFTIFYNKYNLNIDKLTSLNNGIKVYSASGSDSTLYNTNRSIIELNELPEYVKNAFIAVEDKRFYRHDGYDLKRLLKSAIINIQTKSKSQGASTISQQLVKNALLTNEKTYSRKVKELILSIKMEKKFSKDEILEMYLNTIYFGSNAYGIENASRIYFNKTAKDLTLNEACCLAGIIKSPAHYSPLNNYSESFKRKNIVAKLMYANKNINKSQLNEVLNSEIIINKSNDDSCYEKEAIFEACRLLNISERELINKKYQIITFKQDELQCTIKNANSDVISNIQKDINSSVDSLSVVCNLNGQILAYHSNSMFNLHDSQRQPASTLKPLAVYLPCFEHNILSPSSTILDEKINYGGYSPKNADNTYHGYVSVRDSLSQSLNIPAVKALDYLGMKKSKETLSNLGINVSNSDMNLSLALGAVKNGVKLLDLLGAYNTIANNGNHVELCFVDKILDQNNKIIYSHENYSTNVAEEESCFLVTDILKDCAKSGTAKRLESLNLPVASKTGTASNHKGNTDLYNISYTTEHTLLTWIGDLRNNVLSQNLLSSVQPTEINKKILEKLYKDHKPSDFTVPENVKLFAYDLIELENNQILASPNHSIERYINYDYFKIDNKPQFVPENNTIDLNVEINQYGVEIMLNAMRNKEYNIIRKTNKEINLIDTIRDKNGLVIIKDYNIFLNDTISYYLTNENDEIISEIITLKPKDYLVNLLNNQTIQNKRKWSV